MSDMRKFTYTRPLLVTGDGITSAKIRGPMNGSRSQSPGIWVRDRVTFRGYFRVIDRLVYRSIDNTYNVFPLELQG